MRIKISTNTISLDLNTMFLIFLILKLTHTVEIPWWVVTSPVWGLLLWTAINFLGFVVYSAYGLEK